MQRVLSTLAMSPEAAVNWLDSLPGTTVSGSAAMFASVARIEHYTLTLIPTPFGKQLLVVALVEVDEVNTAQ